MFGNTKRATGSPPSPPTMRWPSGSSPPCVPR